MTFSKQQLIDFINEMDIQYCDVEMKLQSPPECGRTEDLREGCCNPMIFKSRTWSNQPTFEFKVNGVLNYG